MIDHLLDHYLVQMYGRYSEEEWAASWMKSPESEAEQFTKWLVSTLSKELPGGEDYGTAGLPTLRGVWDKVKEQLMAEGKAL